MSLLARDHGGGDIELIPEAVYLAVCCGVIDLGTHEDKTFGKMIRKVLVQWEIPEVRRVFERDGQKINTPRTISRRYTLSLSPKANLRKDLESWRGKKFTPEELTGFDLKKVLGAPCQLQIIHETGKTDGKAYAMVSAIMALPKGTPPPRPETPLSFFSFEDETGIPELPPEIPEWVQKIIKDSTEYRQAGLSPVDSDGHGDPPDSPAEDDEKLPF